MAHLSDAEWSELNDNKTTDDDNNTMNTESHEQTDWEMLSESGTNATNLTNPIHHIITHENDTNSITSNNTNNNTHVIPESSAANLIPQISEDNELPILPILQNNNDINNNNENKINESIPSYIDIEKELENQRQIVINLRERLNRVTNERNQVNFF